MIERQTARTLAIIACLLTCLAVSAQKPTPSPANSAFGAADASQLLGQIREGLEGRSQKKFLSVFDISRMPAGAAFKQQTTVFFNQTESIRVHLNLVDITAIDAEHARIEVDAELEATPRNNSLPVHKQTRLTFTTEKDASGWKFTTLDPRTFFSLQA